MAAGPQEQRPVTERDHQLLERRLSSRPPRALIYVYYLFPLDWITSFFSDAFILKCLCEFVNNNLTASYYM